MPIALVIVALVAVGLLVLYVLTRRAAAEYRTGAEARERALTAERDDARDLAATRAGELATARDRIGVLEAQVSKVETENTQLSGVVRRLNGELAEVRAELAERNTRIERQSAEIAALVSENNALHTRAEDAEAAAAAAQAASEAAEARNAGVVIGEVVSTAEGRPETLWALELARSERTWRTSVATDPRASPTPFDTADDPVRLAVEVEAAALRENVGASIVVDWQAAAVDDPARRHLIVRVAQELLEAAARNPAPLKLLVTGDEEIRLRLEPAEPDASVNLIPPAILSDGAAGVGVIDAGTGPGLSVTLKSG